VDTSPFGIESDDFDSRVPAAAAGRTGNLLLGFAGR
jgi:hypothetical protein